MSRLQDPPSWGADNASPQTSPARASFCDSRLVLGPPFGALHLSLRARGLWFPSFTYQNTPELTYHPGAHPGSQGNCLPSALRNHLQLVAVGTQHSCPLPTAWPNKQRCFLLGLALPGWVSYPSTRPTAPVRPGSPQPQGTTHSPSGLSGSRGERESELTSSCSSSHTAQGISKHQADGGDQALGLWSHRALGPNAPVHLLPCDLKPGTSSL